LAVGIPKSRESIVVVAVGIGGEGGISLQRFFDRFTGFEGYELLDYLLRVALRLFLGRRRNRTCDAEKNNTTTRLAQQDTNSALLAGAA
jgi:hypothetical protein